MIIRGASLVNRFYASDGWTAELVAELLENPDARWVTTRYDNEGHAQAYPHEAERSRPSYFAVYDNGYGCALIGPPPPFLLSKINQHEYQPFSMSRMTQGPALYCDRDFSTKNRVLDDLAKAHGKKKKEATNAGQGNDNRRRRQNKRRRP